MANPEHLAILEQGVEVWNEWRKESPDMQPDLRGLRLSGSRLRHLDLSGASLSKVSLWETDLTGACLDGAEATFAEFAKCSLRRATLRSADFSNTEFFLTDLTDADLSGSICRNSYFHGAYMRVTRLNDASFQGAKFRYVTLSFLDMRGARDLETVRHYGPSSVGVETLLSSAGSIPTVFLKGAGLPDHVIEGTLYAPSRAPRSAFISYSHSDALFAERLHNQLQAEGIRCWLDEHALKPGDRILDVVGEAIRAHDRLLLCCSGASLASWWVKDEIRKAQERERKEDRLIIIPLNLDGHLFEWEDGLASDLTSRLAADFTGWEQDNAKFEEQFERVVGALRAQEIP